MALADDYYTLQQAAERLGVERHTVWRWIKAGKLTAEKIGNCVLIDRNLVEARLHRQRTGNGSEAA